MPGGERESVAYSGPALAEVAGEMSEIFARAGLGQTAAVTHPAVAPPVRPGRSQAALAVVIVVMAGLGGLTAGALALRTHPAPSRVEAKAVPRPSATMVAQAQPATSSAERSIVLAEAAPPARTEKAPPAAADSAPQPIRPVARRHGGGADRTMARRRTQARTRLASASSAEAMPPIRLPVPIARSASCEEDSQGDECHRAVLQADRHLRAVYESAIRRGVSRSTLIGYRDRWSDLRDRDTDSPTRLIESYGALAYDLGRERAEPDGPEEASSPRGGSSLKALADLLLPWR